VGRPAPESAAQQSSTPIATPNDPADGTVDPESIYVPGRTADELFGYEFHEVSSHGQTAFGNGNIFVSTAGETPALFVSPLEWVVDLLDYYVEAPNDNRLDAVLAGRHVVCLTGAPGTGRFTSACAALARRHAPDLVHEIHLPPGHTSAVLHGQHDQIVEGSGHVLRLASGERLETIRMLDDVFRGRRATAVLIRDADARDVELHDSEIAHHRADFAKMFEQHVRRVWQPRCPNGCGPCTVDCIEGVLRWWTGEDTLRRALAEAYRPREVVEIAEKMVRHRPRNTEDLANVLSASHPIRRQRATEILLPAHGGQAFRHERIGQYERAFRIAYAVFNRQPVHYVFETAGWLLEQIDREASRPALGRPAFEHPVVDLLGEILCRDWLEGRHNEQRAAPGTSRTVWLRDSRMRGAILEVAWHEFDNTRPALLRWLKYLVEYGDDTQRRAAADVAGLLAHHDFGPVCRQLVDDWASSRSGKLRDAAARVAVMAARGGQVTHQVHEKVRDWVRSRSSYQRDTAARCYASGLRQPYLRWTLTDLMLVAVDSTQQRAMTVASALNQLYEPSIAGHLVEHLGNWISARGDEPGRQASAAQAFVLMAARVTENDGDGRFDLVVQAMRGNVSVDSLADLWAAALLRASAGPSAWDVLHSWIRLPEIYPASEQTIRTLLGVLANAPAMQRRLDFYVNRKWRMTHPWVDAVRNGDLT
jgi:hypothetical protein